MRDSMDEEWVRTYIGSSNYEELLNEQHRTKHETSMSLVK